MQRKRVACSKREWMAVHGDWRPRREFGPEEPIDLDTGGEEGATCRALAVVVPIVRAGNTTCGSDCAAAGGDCSSRMISAPS